MGSDDIEQQNDPATAYADGHAALQRMRDPIAAQQSANQMEPTTQRAMTRILGAAQDLTLERLHNGLGARGRALSSAITKLDEARMWLAEAERH